MLGNIETEGYLLPEHLWTEVNKFGVSKTQAVILAYPSFDRNYGSAKYLQIVRSKTCQKLVPDGFTVYPKVTVVEDREKVDLIPLSEIPLFLQVCRIMQKGKFKPNATEKQYQKSLCDLLNGKLEVPTLVGKIDILTSTEIIEVKGVCQWKSALGQVLAYGHFYPSHQKRIHLFGETQEAFLATIRAIATKYGVTVSWEP